MRRPTRSPAIQPLERLHSELGGLADSMRHVEAVIKMLDPTFNLRRIAVKRRQPPVVQAGRGLTPRRGRA